MKTNILLYLSALLIFVTSCKSQNEKTDRRDTTQNEKIAEKDTVTQNKTFNIQPQDKAKYPDIKSIPVPPGYERIEVAPGTFAHWLRNVKLKTDNNTLYLYDGTEKYNQDLHFAILNFDAGKQDLQQCADAVMRLRAEYLYSQKKYGDIHFNFLSDGKPRYFNDYAGGDKSYRKFRKYMDYIFSYANTASLKKELKPVDNPEKNIKPGDVFIQSGRPYGHAVTVVDVAKNKKGEIIFMVAQSYMPAEEINIVNNLNNPNISPWYNFTDTEYLSIPEWDFEYTDLKRF